jgi:streptogrisin C
MRGISRAALRALLVGGVVTAAGSPGVAAAAAAPAREAVTQLAHATGISRQEARERLTLQTSAGDLAAELERKLGDGFAGVWFDTDTGRFVVGAAPATDRAALRGLLARKGIGDETDVVAASSTWDELVEAQAAWNRRLRPLLERQRARTSIDPTRNRVVVTLSADVSEAQRSTLVAEARLSAAAVAVATAPASELQAVPDACSTTVSYCDLPLRGGIRVNSAASSAGSVYCTAAFPAADGAGNRYLITAGHCFEGDPVYYSQPWSTANAAGTAISLNARTSSAIGNGTGDVGMIGVPSGVSASPSVLMRGSEEARPLLGVVSRSWIGQWLCGTGTTSGTRCGFVNYVHATITLRINGTSIVTGPIDGVAEAGACSDGGDSGGAWMAGPYGAGIHSASDTGCVPGETNWFTPLATAESVLGVNVLTDAASTLNPTDSSRMAVGDVRSGVQWAYYPTSTGTLGTSWWNGTWSSTTIGGPGSITTDSNPAVLRDAPSGTQWVYFSDQSGGLSQWYTNGSWSYASIPTGVGGSAGVMAGTSPTAVFDRGSGAHWVYYTTRAGAIGTSWWDGSAWSSSRIGEEGSVATGTSPTVLRAPGSGTQWVYFSDQSGGLSQWYTNGSWSYASIPTGVGGSAGVMAGTSPTAVFDRGSGAHWVYYTTRAGAIGTSWWDGSAWSSSRIGEEGSVATGTSPSVVRDPASGYQSVYYVNADGRLAQWYTGGSWRAATLGGDVQPGTSPTAVLDPATGFQRVYYVRRGGGVSVMLWNGSAWVSSTLS